MDEMEARMAADDRDVRQDLSGLEKLGLDPDLKAAAASYSRFYELRAQILALSRENTNVRSLSISLDRKRKVMFSCRDALDLLQRAISAELVPGVDYGKPTNPRQLGEEPRAAR
jgi:hypothetical protein